MMLMHLYPSTPIRPVLWWPNYWTFELNRALYSATICVWKFVKLCQSIHGKNVITSFKHEYRRHILTSRCGVISDIMNTKTPFYVNLWCSFYIWCQNEPISNILKCSKWPIFWGSCAFWTGSCTGSLVQQQDRPCHSLHFEILFDSLAQILTELWLFQNLTYFLTSWPSYLNFDLQKHKE